MIEEEFELDSAINQLQREICLDSFSEFVKEMWETLIPNKLVWNWHMDILCDELQIVAERVMNNEPRLYNLIINVPPGTSKSTIGSVMLPAWMWTKKASSKIMSATYAQRLSNDLSLKTRTILESEKYKLLFPEVKIKSDANQKSMFYSEDNGWRLATSVGGSATGFHNDLIVIDDPLSPLQSMSTVETEKANDWFSATLSTRFVDKNVGTLVLIMQRLSENDPTAHLLENGKANIKHICLPAECTDDVRPVELRDQYINDLLDPVRMTKKYLRDFQDEHGQFVYAGQMLQTPTPPAGGMFNTSEIEVVDFIDPSEVVETWRSWDKAGTDANKKKNPTACYTAGAKMARLKDGSFIVMDMVRGRWASDKREATIKRTAVSDKLKTRIVIEQEPGSGGKESAENTIKNLSGFSVVKERPVGDKVFRADGFATQVNIGNVKMLKGKWNKEYVNELKHFPMSRFKDQVDASSMAFARLNKTSAPRIRSL